MPSLLFTEAAQRYIDVFRLENGCSLVRKSMDLDWILVPLFETMPLNLIKRPDIERFKHIQIEQAY